MEAKQSENPWEVTTALCERCGAEEETDDIKDGLCPICQAYPDGSFEWHRACYFDGEANSHEEADAFKSGWRRAESEWEKKTADLLAALEDLVQAHDLKMGRSAVAVRIEIAKDAITKTKGTPC